MDNTFHESVYKYSLVAGPPQYLFVCVHMEGEETGSTSSFTSVYCCEEGEKTEEDFLGGVH